MSRGRDSGQLGRALRRVIDHELDALFSGLPAIAIEGPKAVGKTATVLQRAHTTYRLDDPVQASLLEADRGRVASGEVPILIDEWQRVPKVWDVVRRAVDEDPSPGRFLITGSASGEAGANHGDLVSGRPLEAPAS
jgi:predicted AAA+ superfamily ATPase